MEYCKGWRYNFKKGIEHCPFKGVCSLNFNYIQSKKTPVNTITFNDVKDFRTCSKWSNAVIYKNIKKMQIWENKKTKEQVIRHTDAICREIIGGKFINFDCIVYCKANSKDSVVMRKEEFFKTFKCISL